MVTSPRMATPPLRYLAVALLAAAGCVGAPTSPPNLAALEHRALGFADPWTYDLVLSGAPVTWSDGDLDPAFTPRIAAAFEEGRGPGHAIPGPSPATWQRELVVVPGPGATLELEAKSLTPYPAHLTLWRVDRSGAALLGGADSEAWKVGTHFARVATRAEMPSGAWLVLRIEGNGQAEERAFRVLRAAAPGR